MEREKMKTQLNRVNAFGFDGASGPELITIPVPDDFDRMSAAERIQFLSEALKTVESKYPPDRDHLRRHTALVRMAKGKVTYSVEYLPIPDDDY